MDDFEFDDTTAPPAVETPAEDTDYTPPALDGMAPPPVEEAPATSGFSMDAMDAPAPPAAGMPPMIPEGESHLAKFQEQTREALQKRDAEADKAHQEVRDKAAATIAKMTKEREDKMSEKKMQNLENEKTTKSRNDALFTDGPVWDRVVSLVDMKDDKLARKTARMKEILVHLQTTQ